MATASSQLSTRDWWRRPEPAPAPSIQQAPSGPIQSEWPQRALVTFTVMMMVAPQSFIPALAPLRLAFLSALAAVGTYLIDQWGSKEPSRPVAPEMVVVMAIVVWSIISLPFSLWTGGSVDVLLNSLLKSVVLFWLLANVVSTPERMRTIFWTLSIIIVPLSLTGVANFRSGVTYLGQDGRIQGYQNALSSNPNDLALTLNLFMPLTMALALSARSTMLRLVALGIIGIGLIGVVVTFSRGGFLTLAITGTLHLFLLARRGNWAAVGAAVLAVAIAIPMMPSGYLERLTTIANTSADTTGSAQERMDLMSTALDSIASHPVFGTGLGQDTLAMNQARGAHWLRVHNAYLEYAIDLGIPGLLMFLAALTGTILAARSTERMARAAGHDDLTLMAGAIRISLIGFAGAAFLHPVPYQAYFFYMGGLALALRQVRTVALRASRVAAVSR